MNLQGDQKIFIFLGAPGVGKGALSRMAAEKFGWKQLSTGDLCRKHIAEGTVLGQEIDFAIKSGKLVSDAVIIEMVKDWLSNQIKLGSTVILDGFPRTVVQAEGFLNIMKNEIFVHNALIVVEFVLDDEVIIKRLSSRLVCSNNACQKVYSALHDSLKSHEEGICDVCGSILIQRADDRECVVRDRLKIYRTHVQALKQFYENHDIPLVVVSSDQQIDLVFDAFLSAVGLIA